MQKKGYDIVSVEEDGVYVYDIFDRRGFIAYNAMNHIMLTRLERMTKNNKYNSMIRNFKLEAEVRDSIPANMIYPDDAIRYKGIVVGDARACFR